MTWRFGETRNASAVMETGRRAKPVQFCCENCGAGLDKRKRFCLPCYSDRLQQGHARRRAAAKAKQQQVTA